MNTPCASANSRRCRQPTKPCTDADACRAIEGTRCRSFRGRPMLFRDEPSSSGTHEASARATRTPPARRNTVPRRTCAVAIVIIASATSSPLLRKGVRAVLPRPGLSRIGMALRVRVLGACDSRRATVRGSSRPYRSIHRQTTCDSLRMPERMSPEAVRWRSLRPPLCDPVGGGICCFSPSALGGLSVIGFAISRRCCRAAVGAFVPVGRVLNNVASQSPGWSFSADGASQRRNA